MRERDIDVLLYPLIQSLVDSCECSNPGMGYALLHQDGTLTNWATWPEQEYIFWQIFWEYAYVNVLHFIKPIDKIITYLILKTILPVELDYCSHSVAEETQHVQEKMTKFIHLLDGRCNLSFMALKVRLMSAGRLIKMWIPRSNPKYIETVSLAVGT